VRESEEKAAPPERKKKIKNSKLKDYVSANKEVKTCK